MARSIADCGVSAPRRPAAHAAGPRRTRGGARMRKGTNRRAGDGACGTTEHDVIDAKGVGDSSGDPALRPYAGVLSECRELMRSRACSALAQLRDVLLEELEARLAATADADEATMLGELRDRLRAEGQTLEHTFGHAFDEAFRELARRRAAADRSLYGRDSQGAVELALVDEQAFSEALTVKGQASVLQGACEEELKDLQPRIALMLGIENLDAADNPVGPEAISEALKEACWALDCPRAAKSVLFELLTRKLAPELRTLYRDVNRHLVSRRVLPHIRHAVRRGGAKDPAAPAARPATAAPADAGDVLRQLFAPRDGHDGAAGAGAHGTCSGAGAGVVQMLGRLQRGEAEVMLGGERFSVDAHASATMNVLHSLLDAGLGRHVSTLDGIVIDVVATLFDFIFDDTRVPDAMKGLIGRLQLPVLKLALVDHGFFSNRNHPARRLINAMAQAAATWDGELALDSTLYRATEPLVVRIQNEACEDSSVFAACLQTFEAHLAEQERQADQKAAALTSRLAQREQLELARTVAAGAIAAYCADDALPAAIRDFLSGHWLAVLIAAARDGGEDGSRWRTAVDTMDELVWSVRPKHDTDERQRLVQRLPRLLEALRTGLDAQGADAALREAFFAELVKLHAQAVKAGMAASAATANAATPAAAEPSPAAALADAPPADAIAAAAAGDEPRELAALQRGSWIELHLESGDRRAVRLTWVSPARTLYLFANRQGQRALALTRSELARKLASGEARVADDEPFIDRIVAGVLDDYQATGKGAAR
jgi:hypothetical protein